MVFGAYFWGDVLYRSRFVIEPMIFYSLYRVRDVSHGLCNSFMDNMRRFTGALHKEEHEEILIKIGKMFLKFCLGENGRYDKFF